MLVEDEETGAEEVVDFLDFDEGFFEVEWDDMRARERERLYAIQGEEGKGNKRGREGGARSWTEGLLYCLTEVLECFLASGRVEVTDHS